uniref:Uncharacterized protein n=1 Tax=Arundo donax TaxID=35708 RepID=A0A0A8ZCT8_ARUDO
MAFLRARREGGIEVKETRNLGREEEYLSC